jgi:hypothetical protein
VVAAQLLLVEVLLFFRPSPLLVVVEVVALVVTEQHHLPAVQAVEVATHLVVVLLAHQVKVLLVEHMLDRLLNMAVLAAALAG